MSKTLSGGGNLTKPKFSLVKKLLSTMLAVSMIASIGTNVFAEGTEEDSIDVFSTPTNLQGEKPIATYEPATKSAARKLETTFVHDNGFYYSPNGSSGNPDECVWGETSHIYSNGTVADGYTRARYELGSSYKCDSGRVWDNADGTIDGYSYAVSGWVSTAFNLYTGHTYYGN